MASGNKYDAPFMRKRPANHVPLTPLTFIERTALVFPERTAVVYGDRSWTWRQELGRVHALASALVQRGVGKGDTVALLSPNTPAAFECHYGVGMAGAVLCALNTRLDAPSIAYMLEHSEARVLIVDSELLGGVRDAVLEARRARGMLVVEVQDTTFVGKPLVGDVEYQQLVGEGDPEYAWQRPADEWQAICLNYTSGTTSRPKGVVYSHRGCALQATETVILWRMTQHPVFLWTSPMFHCNGWHFPWNVTLLAGTHICLRDVRPAAVFDAIARRGVTHMGGAPTVLGMLVNAPAADKRPLPRTVELLTAGAPPPAAVLMATESMGFNVTQMYGLTETYGQVLYCQWHDEWDSLPAEEQAAIKARQGVSVPLGAEVSVLDPKTLTPVVKDGEQMGEIMVRGNLVMKGYLKNEKATEEAFAGGHFHSGDLAAVYPDNYVQIKDRSKDIIISGGENISTVEVEGVLFKHPDVMEAAVVARPDPKWGETPCAFVTLRPDSAHKAGPDMEKSIIDFAKNNMARFKAPRTVVFSDLPKTSTGKIQKFVLRDRARALATAAKL